MDLEQIYEYFRENYSHISIQDVNPKWIENQMKREQMKKYSVERQMDLLLDGILSQDFCSIQE